VQILTFGCSKGLGSFRGYATASAGECEYTHCEARSANKYEQKERERERGRG
jgi:hypothetical protein